MLQTQNAQKETLTPLTDLNDNIWKNDADDKASASDIDGLGRGSSTGKDVDEGRERDERNRCIDLTTQGVFRALQLTPLELESQPARPNSESLGGVRTAQEPHCKVRSMVCLFYHESGFLRSVLMVGRPEARKPVRKLLK